MSSEEEQLQSRVRAGELPKELFPWAELVTTLRGHEGFIDSLLWSPDGSSLASASGDGAVKVWNMANPPASELRNSTRRPERFQRIVFMHGSENPVMLTDSFPPPFLQDLAIPKAREWLESQYKYDKWITELYIDPSGRRLAIVLARGMALWDIAEDRLLHEVNDGISCIAFSPFRETVAIGEVQGGVQVWDLQKKRSSFRANHGPASVRVAFHPSEDQLAISTRGGTVFVHGPKGGLRHTLEGHIGWVSFLSYSQDGRCLVSGDGRSMRIWDASSGRCLAEMELPLSTALALHPREPVLAIVGTDPDGKRRKSNRLIRLYQLDLDFLLAQRNGPSQVFYTSAKIVLLGDPGVGKSGLGWRLAHGEFKDHSSTHGQQFWLLKELSKTREDGAECEAVLWDLAGQDDYRLIHALFLDDADLALLLFDPSRREDPLAGVDYWLKHLKIGRAGSGGPSALLIAARCDRGSPRLTVEELEEFCAREGIHAYLATSALLGEGTGELVEAMNRLIPWATKPTTVTTATFKRLKDHVLGLKEAPHSGKLLLTPAELREHLEASDPAWRFSDAEMLTATGHLENHGYVTRLKTSRGEPRILLAPDLLNNLAASMVLAARRQERGLGSLDEKRLLAGGYTFPELHGLAPGEGDILLDSAAALFLKNTICFRATDLLGTTYLIFPELINLKRPLDDDELPLEDGAAYTLRGPVENVYASLVVLMGYAPTFTRSSQWRNQARYEVASGEVCGFRLEDERAGELDLLLYYGSGTPAEVRKVFQSLFEVFLARRQLEVRRFDPLACEKGHLIHRAVLREHIANGESIVHCSKCGRPVILPKPDQPAPLTRQEAANVAANQRAAEQRTIFEQILFRLKAYTVERQLPVPDCFISYAWGNAAQEHWVEHQLATDLRNAGVAVILDRWENHIGTSIPRFLDRAAAAQRVVLVGTPSYLRKYQNAEPMNPSVLATEADLISGRMLGSEQAKLRVLPILLEGDGHESLPPLFQSRVYGDFREPQRYFSSMLDLLLTLFGISRGEPPASEWIRLLDKGDL